MNKRFTAFESSTIISSNPVFSQAVDRVLLSQKPKAKYEDMLLECAARLYADDWFSEDDDSCRDISGYISEEEYLEIQTQQAFDSCVTYGIIPGGFLGLTLYFIARGVAWYFLKQLLEEWWESEKESL